MAYTSHRTVYINGTYLTENNLHQWHILHTEHSLHQWHIPHTEHSLHQWHVPHTEQSTSMAHTPHRTQTTSMAHTSHRTQSISMAHTSHRTQSTSMAHTSHRTQSTSMAHTSHRTQSTSMAHTSHRTQSTTTMETRAWSYWLPWQLGVWLTHSLTLVCTCKERFRIIMKCVTYNHPKLPGQWLLTRHIHKGMWICCQNARWKGIIKKIFTIFFHINFSEHGTANTVRLK